MAGHVGQPERSVPPVLMLFTGLVCMGVMINVTVIIPTASLVGSSLLDAAFVISSYSVGALTGLGLFYAVGKSSVRTAYLLHCVFMVIGNIGFFLAAGALTGEEHFLGLLCSRAVIGLEGAVMYNASVALVQFSSARLRSRYLAYYQFFVGLGLVLGPGIAAVSLLSAGALGLHAAHAFVNLLIAVWGVGLGVALVLFLPDNDELELLSQSPVDESAWLLTGSSKESAADAAEEEAEDFNEADGKYLLMAKMCAGNMIRISLRILWEAGTVIVLNNQFGFSIVNAALVLAAFGVVQTVAQLIYARADPKSVYALGWLEMVQLISILVMFMFGLLASSITDVVVVVVFLMTSAGTYCANCLSSAPFNDILLKSADLQGVDREGMLLVSQVGIFLGFVIGPLSIFGAMFFITATLDTLAAVLLTGWVLQALLTSSVTNARGSTGLMALLALVAFVLLTYSILEPRVGGTGADNLFSWHPIAMAFAFVLLMTWGALSYRTDRDGVTPHLAQVLGLESKKQRRVMHAVLMGSGFVFAVLGYVIIFVAHARINESQIGLNTTWDRALHVWMGYVTLTWLCIQVSAGIFKVIPSDQQPAFLQSLLKLHGTSGKYLLCFAYLVIMLGVWLKMNFSADGWQLPLKIALTALIGGLLGFALLPPPPHVPDGLPPKTVGSVE